MYRSAEEGEEHLYVRPTSGQDDATLIYSADVRVEPTDRSNYGRLIFFNRINPSKGGSKIWTYYLEATGRWMVSSDAGPGYAASAVWRGDGRELFYRRGGAIVAVPVTEDPSFSFGPRCCKLRTLSYS